MQRHVAASGKSFYYLFYIMIRSPRFEKNQKTEKKAMGFQCFLLSLA